LGTIQPVFSASAPRAVGPYSQAISDGNYVYLSGQIGLVPGDGRLAGDDVEAQTRQVTRNLDAVLQEAGCRTGDILKATIYLTDMNDFPAVNAIYADWLGEHRPARATVGVAALPLGAKVEIDLIARLPLKTPPGGA
jgi:2-iminobutanoate/2-iminopropanoate deaminase